MGGAFGAPATPSSPFGTPAAPGGAFGAPAAPGGFGTPAQMGSPAFGAVATPAAASPFGASAAGTSSTDLTHFAPDVSCFASGAEILACGSIIILSRCHQAMIVVSLLTYAMQHLSVGVPTWSSLKYERAV